MMWLYLLGGDTMNLAICPIGRLEAQRVLTTEATSDVIAWFADGSSERLAHFTGNHNEEMAREFISVLIEALIDRASRGIGALWVDSLVDQVCESYAPELPPGQPELTTDGALRRAA